MRIIVLGDSHTRAFAHRKDVYPFFMGPGSKINFNNGVQLIKNKIRQFVDLFDLTDADWVFFHLGEPDCRLQLGAGWHPHKKMNVQSKVNKKYLIQCVSNYVSILSIVKTANLGVIGAATAYPPAFAAVRFFNGQIKEKVQNYFDIFEHACEGVQVKQEYRDPDFKRDPLHLNSKIADYWIMELEKSGITKAKDHQLTRQPFNVMDVKKDFIVTKFGSLTTK